MIAGPEILKLIKPVNPFVPEKQVAFGMSYGLSHAGYDVRFDEGPNEAKTIVLRPGEFTLASTIEEFRVPAKFAWLGEFFGLMGIVHDKSTWARMGLTVQNTVIEPGWRGFLTMELANHGPKTLVIEHGMPIAQIIFHMVAGPGKGYSGKYQGQKKGPVAAILERSTEPV